MDTYQLYIGGKFRDAEDGATKPTLNPWNSQAIANIPVATEKDALDAIAAAREAFDNGPWPRMSGEERSEIICGLAAKMKERMKDLAQLESMDSGGTIAKTGADAFLGQRQMNYFGTMAKNYNAEAKEIEGMSRPGRSYNYTIREPIGVCASIIPWNFPLMMAVWKLGPALGTGNTIVLKPASDTPLSAMELARIVDECGFPPGVVNIISGPGGKIGEVLTTSPDVDKIAFTGSTEVGKDIMAKASGTLKKVTLECGGKSPNIVNGAKQAKAMGLSLVTVSGFLSNNPLRKLGDLNLWVDSSEYNIVEMTHHVWLVAIIDYLIETKNLPQ